MTTPSDTTVGADAPVVTTSADSPTAGVDTPVVTSVSDPVPTNDNSASALTPPPVKPVEPPFDKTNDNVSITDLVKRVKALEDKADTASSNGKPTFVEVILRKVVGDDNYDQFVWESENA
jgi:hypothetical protein